MSLTAGSVAADAPVAVVCGPTAAGKSALAMGLAAHAPVTLISADSRQIYRGFDIGTAKPTPAERAAVPHVGLDIAEPTERWSAWRWAVLAREAIVAARAAGRVPVVVGGTGFYLRALAAPLAGLPPLDDDARRGVADWLDRLAPDEVRRWCERLDPPRARFGPVQWRRAIEVALLTGVPLSTWHARASALPALRLHYLVVDPGETLARRIDARVRTMLDAGWAEEVQALDTRVPEAAPAWQGTGYGVLRAWVRGRGSLADATARISTDTRQYAKRQRTWFRHQLTGGPVTRVAPDDPLDHQRVRAWWRALGEDAL
jgi:tRNA dimethylallyltransferase